MCPHSLTICIMLPSGKFKASCCRLSGRLEDVSTGSLLTPSFNKFVLELELDLDLEFIIVFITGSMLVVASVFSCENVPGLLLTFCKTSLSQVVWIRHCAIVCTI